MALSSGFNSLKYGWIRAYFTLILLTGSRAINLTTRSNPSLSKFLKNLDGSTGLNLGKVFL